MIRFFARWFRRWLGGPAASASREDAPPPPAPMLDCDAVMRQLWDYLDGELTPVRMRAIHAHLELCKRCYPQYEFERSFLDAVAASAREHRELTRLRTTLVQALQARGFTGA